MSKAKKIVFSLLLAGLVFNPALATADVPSAITYLQAQTPDAWITQAMAAAGQTNIPTAHLSSVSGNLATDYAKAILALAAAGENPATFGNVDYVTQLKTYHNNQQMGELTLVNDDIWSVLAMAAVGQLSLVQAVDAKNFIVANQNDDGGFGYIAAGSSDTNDTAAAIMALIEAGLSSSDPVVTNALSYLQNAQNDDGGFGYNQDSESDSGSDAWVISAIYKADQNPSSWSKGDNNPITHLQSLQDADGGFWWLSPAGNPSFNNKAMTAFAVVALSGKSYPIGYYQAAEELAEGLHYLRIEGNEATVCDTQVAGTTAMDLVVNAAGVCGYTYTLTQTSFGPYLSEVAGDQAAGLAGWLYFVNYLSPAVGAADYVLADSDSVLWSFSEWGENPTRLTLDKTEVDPNQPINVTAEYFNSTDWLPLPDAQIQVGSQTQSANAAGHLNLTIVDSGIYQVFVQMPGFIRSQKVTVTVGDTVSQNIDLQVEVDQSGRGVVGGQAIALVVDQAQLDFGKLKPTEAASVNVSLRNAGTVNLNLGSAVNGDSVFTQGLKINDTAWQDYSDSLTPAQMKSAAVSLTVPANYLASGIKTGELIFWATPQ